MRFQTLLAISLLLVAIPIASLAQPQQPPNAFQAPPGGQGPSPQDEERSKIEKDMAKRANQQRQAELKRDTDKLFKLASELKESVDKTNESILSLDVLKKAEEIEKLARSVKEKMKQSY